MGVDPVDGLFNANADISKCLAIVLMFNKLDADFHGSSLIYICENRANLRPVL